MNVGGYCYPECESDDVFITHYISVRYCVRFSVSL